MITNTDADPIQPENRGQVSPLPPVGEVEAVEADRFKDLMKDETQIAEAENAEAAITPEELQRQMRDNLFKSGFNRAVEKAREMVKEMKE